MRWDDLFAGGRVEQELDAGDADVLAEEERLRLARLQLRDRLSALLGERVVVETGEAAATPLRIEAIGRDWVSGSVEGPAGRMAIVPLSMITGLTPEAAAVGRSLDPVHEHRDALARRLGLAFALRDLCRRRCPVEVVTASAARHGTIDRVARDHLDLAEHGRDEARRHGSVRALRLVPFAAIRLVRF